MFLSRANKVLMKSSLCLFCITKDSLPSHIYNSYKLTQPQSKCLVLFCFCLIPILISLLTISDIFLVRKGLWIGWPEVAT